MAFYIGNNLSGVPRPFSLINTNTKFSKIGNMSKLLRVPYISAANNAQQWSIADDIASTPGTSKLHQAMYLKGQSTSIPVNSALFLFNARTELAKLGSTSKLFHVTYRTKTQSNAENSARCTALGQSTTSIRVTFLVEYDQKTKKIRHLLQSKGEDEPIERLMFVDAAQRLGVNHHFEEEIETMIQSLLASFNTNRIHTLHDVSLFFRLLRQGGHYISSDVFNKFKGEDGRFRGEVGHDVKGLMELYEAAQLSFEGESTLDDAENFSRESLNKCLGNMDDYSGRVVINKLRHPFHKSIARLTGKDFHDDLGGTYEWGKTLRDLAETGLFMGRSIYQEELLQVSKWWNDLGLCKKLTLVRNQPIEWHMWPMIMLIDDINFSEQRIELTKPVAFIHLIDDIFDVYGTQEELILFSEAVNKWDYAAIDTLPDYMKMCYKALLDTTNEICNKIHEMHGYNPINTLKATWTSLCNAYLVETKWFASGILPNVNEYLENGKVSSGVYVVLIHLFFLLGLGENSECAYNLRNTSELMSCVAKILRLWNDLGCAKDEHQNGKVGSYIACYMKDHGNLSLAQAQQHALKMVGSEWKRLNKECFSLNNHVSTLSLGRASLNLTRMIPLMYTYNDQLRPVLEDYLEYMLFDQTSSSNSE